MNVRTLLLTVAMLGILSYSTTRADDFVHLNGNDVECCVRYTADTNTELEGHFFANVKVALPFRSPTLGIKWDYDAADEDVMGLPNYK